MVISICNLPKAVVYPWNYDQQGWILSAFSYGYFVTPLLAGILTQKIGGKSLFASGILCSAIFNMLIPSLAEFGPVAVFAARLITGLGEVRSIPCHHIFGRSRIG